jgi:hypothetical protein
MSYNGSRLGEVGDFVTAYFLKPINLIANHERELTA